MRIFFNTQAGNFPILKEKFPIATIFAGFLAVFIKK